jgi:hypothetical protein
VEGVEDIDEVGGYVVDVGEDFEGFGEGEGEGDTLDGADFEEGVQDESFHFGWAALVWGWWCDGSWSSLCAYD